MIIKYLELSKIQRKLWGTLVKLSRNSKIYHYLYKSYWHYLCSNRKIHSDDKDNNFLTGKPNPGAGIGHQLSNWMAGYHFAKRFNLRYAYSEFSNKAWDSFFDFGIDESNSKKLLREKHKKVLLPLFDESDESEVILVKNIIKSYQYKNVVFFLEQDQFLKNLYKASDHVKTKFYNSKKRSKDELIYSITNHNIAIHIRRGDIVNNKTKFGTRKQENKYFIKIIGDLRKHLDTERPKVFYLFSDGAENDFSEFREMEDVQFCLSFTAENSFLHMVYADVLITSKSSFSYKPALLNNGLKICPENFWHGYPRTSDFLLANDLGQININALSTHSK